VRLRYSLANNHERYVKLSRDPRFKRPFSILVVGMVGYASFAPHYNVTGVSKV
jgi:hypothetical protein